MKEFALDKEEVVSALKTVQEFQYFDELQLERLIAVGQGLELDPDEVLIREGDCSAYLYVVLDGTMTVQLPRGEKGIVTLGSTGKGQIFGEAAIFVNVKRTADVAAARKTRLMQIERGNLLSYIRDNPEAGNKLLMIIIYNLLQRLSDLHQDVHVDGDSRLMQREIDEIMKMYLR
jgi:CRP-like cAMP-binding protein